MNIEVSNADLMNEYMHINVQGVSAPEFIHMNEEWADGFRTYAMLRRIDLSTTEEE